MPKIEAFWRKVWTPSSSESIMEQRIQAFEELWRNTVLRMPILLRAPLYDNYEALEFPRPELRRCTNQHEVLPDDLRARWNAAKSYDDQDAILMEYEAMTW